MTRTGGSASGRRTVVPIICVLYLINRDTVVIYKSQVISCCIMRYLCRISARRVAAAICESASRALCGAGDIHAAHGVLCVVRVMGCGRGKAGGGEERVP